jgi:hypothetical protein
MVSVVVAVSLLTCSITTISQHTTSPFILFLLIAVVFALKRQGKTLYGFGG